MENIAQVTIKEKIGSPVTSAPLQFGIPFPEGLYFNSKELGLFNRTNNLLPSNINVTALWPDNSIKWCMVKTQLSLSANEQVELRINQKKELKSDIQCTRSPISETASEITFSTKNCQFSFIKDKFKFIDRISKNGKIYIDHGYCELNTEKHGQAEAIIKDFNYQSFFSEDCTIASELTLTGKFYASNKVFIANFKATLIFYTNTDSIKCSFSLHNPNPAVHEDGLWDLGDPNSLIFSSLNLGLHFAVEPCLKYRLNPEQSWKKSSGEFSIYQESSGGDKWKSPNHKNSDNIIPFKINGFEYREQNQLILSGKRTLPSVQLASADFKASLYIENFWQNFPKSLSIRQYCVNIGLFPEQFNDGFELQPGEKKTHHFIVNFGDDENAFTGLINPPEVTLNPEWIELSKTFSYFNKNYTDDRLYQVIREGIYSENNFFSKRENLDEYGWRNFGELYADHETDCYTGNEIFVSHYNNQYDPIYGFLRQYALSGDYKWFELADDLAKHVIDIDIYHSQHDKEEYNGGLFWHTDHYLDAATSSHRSYSRHQAKDAYIDHAGGGGPGGQHCYTSGLLYHYLLTGNEASKKALLQLVDWVTRVYEGTGTVMDVLLAIKNRHRIDLKNIITGKYPLDRGTGNYINALLDKYTLTQEPSTLSQVESVIQNTVHPLDDLHQRDLKNVEINWYYTVFFQSACRYLQVKEELCQLDQTFYYVRDTLLHYADWMLKNEYPYLEKPEILEFPNHTWTAQDIRKVNILLTASYYSNEKTEYTSKAREIYTYITDTLTTESTRTYTRILSILMQNHGAVVYYDQLTTKKTFEPRNNYSQPDSKNPVTSVWNLTKALLSAFSQFSVKREITWLARRSEIIARLFNYHAS